MNMDNQKLVKMILINYKLLKQYPYTCTTTAIVTNKAKKKKCYVALTRPKFENWVGRSGFFFFFFFFTYREKVEFSNIFF